MVFASGSSLKAIGLRSFCNAGIERIAIPESVEEISENAFEECENLREVVFEEGSRLNTIRECTFKYCSHLARIELPEGLKSIGVGAF